MGGKALTNGEWKDLVGTFLEGVLLNEELNPETVRAHLKAKSLSHEAMRMLLGMAPQQAIDLLCASTPGKEETGNEFLQTQRVRVLSNTAIEVNLDALPKLPFGGAKIEFQTGGRGWVKVEKRTDGLFVNGYRVILHLSECQKNGKVIRGHDLREELSGKSVLHPNIMDAMAENPHLIPEDWKKDDKENTLYIFFWAVIFRGADGNLYVRYLSFYDGQWPRYYSWLACDWDDYDPAALASTQDLEP